MAVKIIRWVITTTTVAVFSGGFSSNSKRVSEETLAQTHLFVVF